MAPVENRAMIDSIGSTSSIGTDVAIAVELEQAAQRHQLARLVVDRGRVLLEDVVALRPRRVLQLVHRVGVEQVRLALAPPLVLATEFEACGGHAPRGGSGWPCDGGRPPRRRSRRGRCRRAATRCR